MKKLVVMISSDAEGFYEATIDVSNTPYEDMVMPPYVVDREVRGQGATPELAISNVLQNLGRLALRLIERSA